MVWFRLKIIIVSISTECVRKQLLCFLQCYSGPWFWVYQQGKVSLTLMTSQSSWRSGHPTNENSWSPVNREAHGNEFSMELTLTLRNTAHMTRNFLKLRPGLTLWLLQMHWVNGDLVERDKQRLTCTWVQIPAKCRFGTCLGTISCAVRGFPIV